MAFRDLIPKYNFKKKNGDYEPKAERKIPGEQVKVSSGDKDRADFNKVLIQTALDHVTQRISQSTRDLYQGKVNAELRPDSPDMMITVTLTHLHDKSEITGNLLVTRVAQNSGLTIARQSGAKLGGILVRELSEKHKHPKRPVLPYEDYYKEDVDDDGRTLDEIARDDRILELMKKPICPICGPASIDFPDWDECDHDY